MKLRIGTRTSLMAMAQARKVASLLHDLYPDIECEFVGIKPAGDKDKTTPLWQMQTIGIFSKELDDELLAGTIDLAVHSLKDLGTIRPEGIATAALLKRDDPRDIILFHPRVFDKLTSGQKIVIGTSAPRRTQLLPDFLARCLPKLSDLPIETDLVTLRGNANTRISKLQDPRAGEPVMDGIVLALAGLGRLYNDEVAHPELLKLTHGLLKMVVPLTLCPGAPGQGTICIEALSARPDILAMLKPLHDEVTGHAISAEYEVLKDNGGGCHQRFGAVSLHLPNIEPRVLIKIGLNKDGEDITAMDWQRPEPATDNLTIWNGNAENKNLFAPKPIAHKLPDFTAAFIAHANALPDNFPKDKRIWVSGVASWEKLAAKGYWVEGCSDSFGFEFIRPTLAMPFLELPTLDDWIILSSVESESGWNEGRFIATYSQSEKKIPDETIENLQMANALWITSPLQFEAIKSHLPATICLYACGPGKTAKYLEDQGVKPLYVFPNYNEFHRWANERDTFGDRQNPSPADAG